MKRKTIKKSNSKFANKPSFKWVVCSKCHVEEVKVSEDAEGATCSMCVQKMCPPPVMKSSEAPKSTGRPRGWQFMKLFVDKDGLVYHKGVEKPKLKGTLPPTEIKKNKKSAFERNQEQLAKETKLANKYKKKQDKGNGKNSNRRRRAKKTK